MVAELIVLEPARDGRGNPRPLGRAGTRAGRSVRNRSDSKCRTAAQIVSKYRRRMGMHRSVSGLMA